MTQVKLKWVGKGQFVGTDSTKHSLVMSTQDEENGTGLKPSDLLLLALGGCTGIDVISILSMQRKNLKGLEINIAAEQILSHHGPFVRSTSSTPCLGENSQTVQSNAPLSSPRRSAAPLGPPFLELPSSPVAFALSRLRHDLTTPKLPRKMRMRVLPSATVRSFEQLNKQMRWEKS